MTIRPSSPLQSRPTATDGSTRQRHLPISYQFDSARDYDPTPHIGRISARVLAINATDDERNPPELGVMEQAMGRLKHGTYVLLPVTGLNRGHSSTYNAALWKNHLAEFLSGR